jgi:hypothetical protein
LEKMLKNRSVILQWHAIQNVTKRETCNAYRVKWELLTT